ncbi:hypothetical protein ACFQL4_16550 [Halosimplex aquaticum]
MRVSGPDGALRSGERNVTVALIANGSERYIERRFPDRRVARYQPDGESGVYVRHNRSGNVTYETASGPIRIDSAVRPVQASWLASFDYTDEGLVQTNRGERRKFTVTSVEAVDQSVADSYEGELTDVNYTVYVDPDRGIVTQLVYSAELERENGTVTLATAYLIRDVGSSTYDPPRWLDEAKANTE